MPNEIDGPGHRFDSEGATQKKKLDGLPDKILMNVNFRRPRLLPYLTNLSFQLQHVS